MGGAGRRGAPLRHRHLEPGGDRPSARPRRRAPAPRPSPTTTRASGAGHARPGGVRMTDLLKADSITVRFGGVTANDGVDVTVGDGELVGIIGPNGAGKTTFIDAITGFVPSEGRVQIDGDELSRSEAHTSEIQSLMRTTSAL